MGHELRPGLYFCQVGTGYIFLDLEQDRYFRLDPKLEDRLRALLESGGRSQAAIAALTGAGILRAAPFGRSIEPMRMIAPVQMPDTMETAETHPVEVARAIATEMWIGRQLRSGRIAKLIAALRPLKLGRALAVPVTGKAPRKVIGAYESAKLFRSPAGRCLSRSLAMVRRLAGCDCAAHLVIGVRAEPFAAHCWVQAGDLVLNDLPDEVSRYTPILVA